MEKESKKQVHSSRKATIILGAVLLLIGILLVFFNLGIIDKNLRSIIISWPMLLIALGIANLIVNASRSTRDHLGLGVSLLLVGCFFIIPKLAMAYPSSFTWVPVNFTSLFWPILLIILGLCVLLGVGSKQKNRYNRYKSCGNPNKISIDDPQTRFIRKHVFGGGEYIILDPVFYGGDLEVVFGGISLDLRKTSLPEGQTLLKVEVVFGGITVFVPEDWFVDIRVDAVFGGVSDNRLNKNNVDLQKRLIVDGEVVFGGIEIKN